MKEFMLCAIPLLVAVDALGLLPVYVGLTRGMSPKVVNKILWQSLATAVGVALAFLYVGESLFRMLDVTSADFMVAGGVLLFILSMSDLLFDHQKEQRRMVSEDIGVVPLGVPLLVGPAVLTTVILLSHRYGHVPTAWAIVANVAFAGVLFAMAARIVKALGETGVRGLSKIASLILAAIAVRMVREGLMLFFASAA